MVRTVANHGEDDRDHDSYSPADTVRVDQKVDSSSRSKHSETEQRRRSKINERFQILRDLIPENDQKRDKASLLLEAIQYIQFLQEKLQVYEGTYQGWSPDPAKMTPWKLNSGPVESFLDHSHFERPGSVHEYNSILNTSLSNTQNSVESDLPVDDCSVPTYPANENALKSESGEASISSAYSQGLINSLTNALQSSGVDLSRTSISVKLDIGKQTNSGSTVAMDHLSPSCLKSVAPELVENYEHTHKRFRSNQS